jgi:hypothetical protein
MGKSVIGVGVLYFAYPSHSFYFIGRRDCNLSITDVKVVKTVTVLGDSLQVLRLKPKEQM